MSEDPQMNEEAIRNRNSEKPVGRWLTLSQREGIHCTFLRFSEIHLGELAEVSWETGASLLFKSLTALCRGIVLIKPAPQQVLPLDL